jgi:hypothetical protein
MSLARWALVSCVVFTGVWSGLLAMLTLVMHRMLAPMSGDDFARFQRAFLPTARRAPVNYAAIIGMIVSPVVALFALGTSAGAAFTLTAIGLGLTVMGPLVVSNRLAEPNYDVMLAWNPGSLPAGWENTRARYYAFNWIRAAATWMAFALFLAALLEQLPG